MAGKTAGKASGGPGKRGRPSKKTPALCQEILDRLINGEPLAQICRDPHMPHRTAIYSWMDSDPEFSQHFERARDDGFERIAVDCLGIVDEMPPKDANGKTDSGHVAWQRNRAETRLKLLAKWNPKKYGDKVQAEVSGPDGGAIVVSDKERAQKIAALLALAAQRKDKE